MLPRKFDPTTARRYGRTTLLPDKLVIDNPKYDFSKLRYFQYLPGRPRPFLDITSRASYGIYLGINSPHNSYGCLGGQLPQTSSRAEIEAAVQAVEMVANLDLTGQRTTKVIIKTDSDYLHKSMTDWIWTWMTTGGVGSRGEEVKHWPCLLALHQRIQQIENAKHIRILFWWVPREFNKGADGLANLALDREDSAYGST